MIGTHDPSSVFFSQLSAMALVAVLLDRLGGEVEISQDEFDAVAGFFILEDSDPERSLKLTLSKGRVS